MPQLAMSELDKQNQAPHPGVKEEVSRLWGALPDKPLFLVLFGTWLVFFHFLGNSCWFLSGSAQHAPMSNALANQLFAFGMINSNESLGFDS